MKTLKQFVESAQDGEQWEDNEMVISARTSAMDGKLYFYPENKQRRANYGRYTATALIHKFASHLEPDEQETTQYLDANTTMRDFVKPKAGVWGGKREGAGRKPGGQTYQAGYNAGYQAGVRATVRTIETSFDMSSLPRWARNYPAVIERCKNNLSYRANVHSATTKQMRDFLKREVGIPQ